MGESGFDDREFLRLCAFVASAMELRRRPSTWRAVVGGLRGLPSAVGSLRRLPRLEVAFSSSPTGESIAQKLRKRQGGIPAWRAVSVLAIPEDTTRYRSGRSRQALRTNCRRATEAGVTCGSLPYDEARERAVELLTARDLPDLLDAVLRHIEDGIGEFWVADSTDGATETLALVTVDRAFARLEFMCSAGRGHSPSRYLLSAHLVDVLSARGVRHLAVGSALFLEPGHRHFQQLLGFVPTTIEVCRAAVPAPRAPADTGRVRVVGTRLRA